jgi:hypothetical protein
MHPPAATMAGIPLTACARSHKAEHLRQHYERADGTIISMDG